MYHYSLDRDQKRFLKEHTLHGWEIVDNTARLCVMNLFLHGIGSDEGSESPVRVADSLRGHPSVYFDMVLTNPPFGRKSSVTFVNEKGREEREASVIVRDDFWTSTSNKQLNFVQHVKSLLTINGRAAIVVPDNVLFEGSAGEIIRPSCCRNATYTPCCACQRASSMRRASKQTCSSSIENPPARAPVGLRPAHQPAGAQAS